MKPFRVLVDVPNLIAASGPDGHFRRVAGMMEDDQTVTVATMVAGEHTATPEFSFSLGDAHLLVEKVLAGDRRALTTPGVARILSATAAILFRVSLSAGSIQPLGAPDERSQTDDDD